VNSGQVLATVARSATAGRFYILLVGSQQDVIRVVAQGADALSAASVSLLGDILAGMVAASPSSHGRERVGKIITSWAYEELVAEVHLKEVVTSKYRCIFFIQSRKYTRDGGFALAFSQPYPFSLKYIYRMLHDARLLAVG